MHKLRIILDMDGPLVDFDSGAAIAHGITPKELYDNRQKGEWSIVRPMSRALGLDTEMSLLQFWEPIYKMGVAFWEDLQPTPWYSDLTKYLWNITEGCNSQIDLYIATDPSYSHGVHEHSMVGKSRWLQRRMGAGFDRMIPTPHKHLLANHQTILIDDSDHNCRAFRKAGGGSILFPHVGNRHHYDALMCRQVKRVQEELDLVIGFKLSTT